MSPVTDRSHGDEKDESKEKSEEVLACKSRGGPSLEDGGRIAMGVEPGPADELSKGHARTSSLNLPRGSTSVFDEIRRLHEKLFDLEEQVVQGVTGFEHVKTVESMDIKPEGARQDDWELRKRIRRAASAKQWTKKVEQQSQEQSEERKHYGQAPNKDLSLGNTSPTMFHVQKDGTIQRKAILEAAHDWNAEHPIRVSDETPIIKGPNAGEIYERYVKLGPPTEWDQSDSEEWSSDASIRSRDFNYFRSRLRGDFEWELDRLNAQVRRYRKHKAKREARARREREDKAKLKEEHSWREIQSRTGLDRFGKSSLNPVGWKVFQVARMAPKELAAVIDILTEEPKIEFELSPWMKIRMPKLSAIDKSKKPAPFGFKMPAVEAVEREDQPENPHGQFEHWNGQGALPERIRINSKSIIESLSTIHGEAISTEEPIQPMIVLRPFRILSFYEKEIREMTASSMEEIRMNQTTSAPQVEVEKPQTSLPLTTSVSQGACETASTTVENAASQKATTNEELQARKEHLTCLQRFIGDYIGKKIAFLNSSACRKIVFSDLWYLFQPGTMVLSADGKQAYQVVNVRSKQHKGTDPRTAWDALLFADPASKDSDRAGGSTSGHHPGADISIQCVYIHFDGRELGPVLKRFNINKWDGEKDISSLEMHPLRLHILKSLQERPLSSTAETSINEHDIEEGVQNLRYRLIDRGRLFAKVAAVRHMYYSGLAVNTRDEIESQVMIDFEAALSEDSRKGWVPRIKRLVGTDWDVDNNKDADKECSAECCRHETVHNDSYVETRNRQNFINSIIQKMEDTPHKLPSPIIFPRPLGDSKHEANEFTEDEYMIMSYSVFGFVLRDRTWAELDLEYLSDVATGGSTPEQANDDLDESDQGAFGQLVLPKGHKKMVLSLISQHFRKKGSADMKEDQVDIVRGKGDLGSSPKEVESAVQTNFALASRWGCILLLDEADVFLAERRREDFNRNGMVAVFLRVLEYYAGILFLTTNRIGDFDEAFASRIHMSLHYPALDELSTMKVFRLNLGMIKNRLKDSIKIDEDEIISAAMKHWREHTDARWNGRQIRNACQTALALAENEAQPKGQKYSISGKSTTKVHLTLVHLKVVSDAYLDFTKYLKAVHGADAEGRAKESGLRALDTLLEALKSDKVKRNNDSSISSDNNPRRPATSNSPLQGFTLRPSSSEPYSGTAAPATPEPRPAQYAPQSGWVPSQWSNDSPAFQAQRTEHAQQRFYATSQPLNDPQPGTPTTQPGSAGRHLHTPQPHSNPIYGQYPSSSMHESQGSQPYGAAAPAAAHPHGPSGPQSHGIGPEYYAGGDQSGSGQ
ncbi:hypothetical protein N0V82_006924 [Gnomoniopsis sp. IMI 355080]|nr:hypothetical protein N0V82_006924 [Gnomoniopsis sp. IMI 355080]